MPMIKNEKEERCEMIMYLLTQMVRQYGPVGKVDVQAIVHLLSISHILTDELAQFIVQRVYTLQKDFWSVHHLSASIKYHTSGLFVHAIEEIKTKIREVINV